MSYALIRFRFSNSLVHFPGIMEQTHLSAGGGRDRAFRLPGVAGPR
jgi:hypothetical protein